jgi:CheY-like chemotaxis protein
MSHLLTSERPPDSITSLPAMSAPSAQKGIHSVLVVDDEFLIADTLVQILNKNGFQAYACYNGRDAVETASRLQPNTVLSDVAMPHFDGVQAAIAIRELCPSARIVLFSGQAATIEILERARALGHDFELLPKPIHPVELLRYLRAN